MQMNLEGDPIREEDQNERRRREYQQKYKDEHKKEAKEYGRRYRQKHKEKLAKQKKEYYYEHREERLEYDRKYYQEHREERLEYNKEYHQQRCKDPEYRKKRNAHCRKYYYRHKEKTRKRHKKRYEEFLKWIWSIKRSVCVCCGEYERRFMHFHHIMPKLFDITHARRRSKDEIRIELTKCVILCANCHEMLHRGLGKRSAKPFPEIISILNHQPYHPELRWLVFLLYPSVYPQTPTEWHEVWGQPE